MTTNTSKTTDKVEENSTTNAGDETNKDTSKKVDRVEELPDRKTRSGKTVIGEQNVTEKKPRVIKKTKQEKPKQELIPKPVSRKRKKIERVEPTETPVEHKQKKRKIQPGSVKEQPQELPGWGGWKDIFLVGMELNLYDEAYKIEWDFDHLYDKLIDENSELNTAKYVYLFGTTEPQLVEKHGLCYVPVIVAVVGDVAPPSKVGINSVQMTEETILDMNKMKMAWVPAHVENLDFKKGEENNVYMLSCKLRRNMLKHMKEEDVRKYEYCLPFYFKPTTFLSDSDANTEISVVMTIEGRGIMVSFDYANDSLKDCVTDACEDNDLDFGKYKDTIKDAINEEVKKQKDTLEAKNVEKKKMLDALSDNEKKGLNEMKFYKFYPQNKDPVVTGKMSAFINRYYGNADAKYGGPDATPEVQDTGLLSFGGQQQ